MIQKICVTPKQKTIFYPLIHRPSAARAAADCDTIFHIRLCNYVSHQPKSLLPSRRKKAYNSVMSNTDPTLELLLLGGLVAYIGYTYWRLIGTKTQGDHPSPGHLIHLSTQDSHELGNKPSLHEINVEGKGFYVLEKNIPGFNTHHFLNGVNAAFKMIVEAFARGDRKILKPLLSAPIFKDFCNGIAERKKNGETLETTVTHINKVTCVHATITGGIAQCQLQILSSQLNKLTKADGTIEETSADNYDSKVDVWTFEKALDDESPNWTLIAVSAAAD